MTAFIALSKQGREQLEAQWASEREQMRERSGRADLHSPAARPGDAPPPASG